MGKHPEEKLSVFVATRFLDVVEAELDEAFVATFASGEGAPLDELAKRDAAGERFDVVLFSLDVRMGTEEIAELPESVRALATYSVGTDHIDFDAAADRSLAVFNTPGVLADSVAEDAVFLMLAAARRATESIDLIRAREWTGWTPRQLVGVQLSGRTLGILGMGDIGDRIAKRAQALGMEVLYCNRRQLADDASRGLGFRATPAALVADSDVLMITCPSTPETRGSVDAALLGHARDDLIVVNIARGDIVDDDALVAALSEGRIRGAALDVFANEPNVDPRYFDLPNVFMVPHIGSSTIEARLGMGRILITGLGAWQAGETPPNRAA
jgi:glyoxylate reductase